MGSRYFFVDLQISGELVGQCTLFNIVAQAVSQDVVIDGCNVTPTKQVLLRSKNTQQCFLINCKVKMSPFLL